MKTNPCLCMCLLTLMICICGCRPKAAAPPAAPPGPSAPSWEIVGFYGAVNNGGTFVRTVKKAPVKVGDTVIVAGTGLYDGRWSVLEMFQFQGPADTQKLWGYRIEAKWQGFPPGFTARGNIPPTNAAKLEPVRR